MTKYKGLLLQPFKQDIKPPVEGGGSDKLWDLTDRPYLSLTLVVILPMFSTPLLWIIYQLRTGQRYTSSAARISYDDDSWGFRQIVAIVMYAPVVLEVLFTLFYVTRIAALRKRTGGQ